MSGDNSSAAKAAATTRTAAAALAGDYDEWTPEVEVAAASNLERTRQRLDLQAQISSLQSRLSKLQAEHRRSTLMQELRADARPVWPRLPRREKWRKDVVLAALRTEGRRLPDDLREREWNRNTDSADNRNWYLGSVIPKSLIDDEEVFLARLARRKEFDSYYYGASASTSANCHCYWGLDSSSSSSDDSSSSSSSDDEYGNASDSDDSDSDGYVGIDADDDDDSSSSSSSDNGDILAAVAPRRRRRRESSSAPKLRIPEALRNDESVIVEVLKVYPDAILQDEEEGGFDERLLESKDVFRAFLTGFLRKPGLEQRNNQCPHCYMTRWEKELERKATLSSQIGRFAVDKVRSDADLMVEAIKAVKDTVPAVKYIAKGLRNDKDFCLKAAAAMMVETNYQGQPPLTLKNLSGRLRADIDVVKAFCRFRGENLQHASLPLRRHCSVVKVACEQNPSVFRYAMRKAKDQILRNKNFRVAFFDKSKHERHLSDEEYAKLWNCLPLHVRASDRDVAIAAARSSEAVLLELLNHDSKSDISKNETSGDSKINNQARSWCEDVRFWEALTTGPSCRPEYWLRIPPASRLKEDENLALKVAQSISEWYHEELILAIAAKFPSVLADRQVILALVKYFPRDALFQFLSQEGPQRILGSKDFALEICRLDGAYELISPELYFDRDIVEAALAGNYPAKAISMLPHPVQQEFPDLIADAIGRVTAQNLESLEDSICHSLWNNRDVVMAWARQGGDYLVDLFPDEFEQDEDLFVALAEHDPSELEYADESLFSKKDFMLRVVQVDPYSIERAASRLHGDFDLMLTTFSNVDGVQFFIDSCPSGLKELTSFAVELRRRLALHKAFVTVLVGIHNVRRDKSNDQNKKRNRKDKKQRKSATCFLPLLNQGKETSRGYMERIVQYVGLDRGENLERLRKASLNLARWGY